MQDLNRLKDDLSRKKSENHLLLIGRRDIRTNNSWLHNANRLVKGKNRCTLLINPQDMHRHGFQNGDIIGIKSRIGHLHIALEESPDMMPGVISIPHGWGHDRDGVMLDVARKHGGVSLNDLTDETEMDQLIGTPVLNAIPVELFSLS